MIRIPLTPDVSSAGQLAPQRSAGEGTQSLQAFDKLAQTVGNVGQNIFDTSVKLKRIENERMVNKLKLGLRETQANFQNSIINDHKPETWEARHKEAIDGYIGSAGIDKLPPEAREQFEEWSSEFRSGQALQVTRDATVKSIRRAGEQAQNNISRYVEQKNYDAAREEIMGNSIFSPEEKDAAIQKLDTQERDDTKREQMDTLTASVMANPFEMEERITAGEFDGDLEDLEKQQLIGRIRTAKNQVTGDVIDSAYDGMSDGTITKPEQIDERFPGVPPRIREKLKLDLAKRARAEADAYRKTPEYQAQTVGKVSAMLDGMDSAEPDDFAERYAQASYLIDSLPDSAAKIRLVEEIKATKTGRKERGKDRFDAMRAALDEAAPRIAPGLKAEPEAQSISIQKAVSDGILTDARKLNVVFRGKDDVWKKIIAAQKNEDGETVEKPIADSAMAELFREEFGKLTPEEQQAGLSQLKPIDRAIFEGIRDRAEFSKKVSYVSPEAEDTAITSRMEAQERIGRVRMKMEDWIASPEGMKADAKAIDDKLFEISGGEVRKGAAKKFFDDTPKSESLKGADDSTSMLPKGSTITEVVKHFEAGGAAGGFHRTAYWDYGQWSIGYGTKAKEGEVIDMAEAENRLQAELASHRKRVDTITAKLGYKLAEHEKDALTSFDYNTGKLETLLADGTRSKAEIAEKMLLYRNAGGERLRGLERRRAAERHLFLNGYQS